VAAIVQYAKDEGFSDMEIVSFIAHGYPGPELSREAVLGPPHVGALRNMEALDKCAAKDRQRGWARGGFALPPMWPMRADPMNIVFRNGKPRMTIDKSMQLVGHVEPYNACIDLDAQPAIEYVTVTQLGRAGAILAAVGAPVLWWGFDLEAYFRKTGKQAADVWMSGFVHGDGYGVDERVQFGQREAPVLCGRQSCFVAWAIRRELRRLDAAYPSRHEAVLAWLEARAQLGSSDAALLDALFFVCIFVDDVGAASLDDELYRNDGTAWFVERDGVQVRMTRAWLHYEAAVGVIKHFGHSAAADKLVAPCSDMVYLGVTLDFPAYALKLSPDKCSNYGALIAAVLDRRAGASQLSVLVTDMSAIIHRLLHAASVVPLGRQHLFHVMRAMKARMRMQSGSVMLGARALAELEWWAVKLRSGDCIRGVPLAYRCAFPSSSDSSVLVLYSDASREVGAVEQSGFGAWAVIGHRFFYVEGRWTEEEVAELDINTLELLAMNIGTFSLLAEAQRQGRAVTHALEFTDNTAAEHSAERGTPKSVALGELVRQRFDAFDAAGVVASSARVASEDNDVADGLSRGGEQLVDALRMAASAGMSVTRLEPLVDWRDSSAVVAIRRAA
jgi:hypothetical protein